MTAATPPNAHPTDTSSVTGHGERRKSKVTVRPAVPSGWYDPDGAAWEAERPAAFEAFRATPMTAPSGVGYLDYDQEN